MKQIGFSIGKLAFCLIFLVGLCNFLGFTFADSIPSPDKMNDNSAVRPHRLNNMGLGSVDLFYIPVNMDILREELMTLSENSTKRISFEARGGQVQDVLATIASVEMTEGIKLNVRKQKYIGRAGSGSRTLFIITPDYLIKHGNHFHRASETERNAGFIFICMVVLFMGSHALLKWWKATYPSSHDAFTLAGLWLVPALISVYMGFYRFLLVWALFSALTAYVLRKSMGKNVSGSVPREVYSFFLYSYKIAYAVAIVGYVMFMLDLFGVTMLLGLAPMPKQQGHSHSGRPSDALTGKSTTSDIKTGNSVTASVPVLPIPVDNTTQPMTTPADTDSDEFEKSLTDMAADALTSDSLTDGKAISSDDLLKHANNTMVGTDLETTTATQARPPAINKPAPVIRKIGDREIELSRRGALAIQVIRGAHGERGHQHADDEHSKSNSGDEPGAILAAGFVLMFYGIYFGLLGRDISAVAAENMAVKIGYYTGGFRKDVKGEDEKDGRSLTGKHASQRLADNTCAICDDILHPHLSMEAREAGLAGGVVEKVQKLSCGHEFHDFCLRGWLLVGKRDTCAYCNEKATYSQNFTSPWEKHHVAWASFLDMVRFVLVFNPIIIVAMNVLLLVFY